MADNKPWPWPGDSREDKAKRVCGTYRGLVQRIAQGRCDDPAGDLHRLDEHWIDLGIYWVRPDRAPLELDEWVDLSTAAHFSDRSEQTIRVWAHRGVIDHRTGRDGTPEYLIESLVRYSISQRNRREQQRARGGA